MTNQDLVLKDIERCKALAPIMADIEPDGYWILFQDCFNNNLTVWRFELKPWTISHEMTSSGWEPARDEHKNFIDTVPTFRQDKLALRLPEWVVVHGESVETIENHLIFLQGAKSFDSAVLLDLAHSIFFLIEARRKYVSIQQQLEATCDLLILLNKEGLL